MKPHSGAQKADETVDLDAAGSSQPNADLLEETQQEVSEVNGQICDEMSENLPVKDGVESENVEGVLVECGADNTAVVSGEVDCDTSEFVNGSPE